jgi:hypothetical protein
MKDEILRWKKFCEKYARMKNQYVSLKNIKFVYDKFDK